jgi:hypothetical protein
LTVHTSASDPGGTFSGRLEVDGGLTLKNGAMVDVGHGNTTLPGLNLLRTRHSSPSTSFEGALTANNSLLNTQVAIIGDKTVNGNMGLDIGGTWNTVALILGQDAGSKGILVVDSSTITLTDINVEGVSGSGLADRTRRAVIAQAQH